MTTYFTSDLHFLHKNIIAYNRPYYSDVEEMNESIISTINKKVTPNDTLYILGDVALGSITKAVDYISRINCNIKLVPGNHDNKKALNAYEKLSNVEILPTLCEIKLGDKTVVLCHFPLVSWNKMHHGAWHLFGHTHGSYEGLGRSIDIGWDNYFNIFNKPGIFSTQDLVDIMENRQSHQVDHHK